VNKGSKRVEFEEKKQQKKKQGDGKRQRLIEIEGDKDRNIR